MKSELSASISLSQSVTTIKLPDPLIADPNLRRQPDIGTATDPDEGRLMRRVGNPRFDFGNVGGVRGRLLRMMRAGRK